MIIEETNMSSTFMLILATAIVAGSIVFFNRTGDITVFSILFIGANIVFALSLVLDRLEKIEKRLE